MGWIGEGNKGVTGLDLILRGVLFSSFSSRGNPSLETAWLGSPRTPQLTSVPDAIMLGPPRVFPPKHTFPLLLIHPPFQKKP